MYNLSKAKEEIDAVARHATDIATHMLSLSDDVAAKLDTFRTELLDVIEAKFAELKQSVQGEGEIGDSGALAQLGAKMALFARGDETPAGPAAEAGTATGAAAGAILHGEISHGETPADGHPLNHGEGGEGEVRLEHGDEHRPDHEGEHRPDHEGEHRPDHEGEHRPEHGDEHRPDQGGEHHNHY